MGEGGSLALVNGTSHRWQRTEQSAYQMNSWNFPESIEPEKGNASTYYVEFDQGIFTDRSDTDGHVDYRLDGTDCVFRIRVRDSPSRIWVEFHSLETANNPRGSILELGWRHDGVVSFILSGKPGSFHSTNPPVDWMQSSLNTLSNRPLSEICLLGTHDSGMSVVTHCDIPGGLINDYVLTQSTQVLGQLILGSRYFDIRPQVSEGQFWTGHYTGKLGGRGESIASIIDAVNQFLSQHQELVILNFSHAVQTDDEFRDFNDDDWHRLLDTLLRLNNRFIVTDADKACNLSTLALHEFIGTGRGAVICVIENERLDLKSFAQQGFYKSAQLNFRNEYADKDDAVVMVQDQVKKMKGHMPAGDKRLFLLSWTLTQQLPSWDGNVIALMGKIASFLKPIRTLAYSCNKELMTKLLPEVSKDSFPNVIYIDYLDTYDYLALTLAINDRVFNN